MTNTSPDTQTEASPQVATSSQPPAGTRLEGRRRPTGQAAGFLLVLVCGALWGTIGPFIQIMADNGSTALLTSFLRMAFAFVIMLVATLALRGPGALRIGPRDLAVCAALGIVCHGIYNVFYCQAVELAGVTVAAVLLNVAPAFGAVMSAVLFKERITARKAAFLALCVAGCALAACGGGSVAEVAEGVAEGAVTGGNAGGDAAGSAGSDGLTGSAALLGIACGVAAGFCYSLTAIIGRLAGQHVNAFATSTYGYLFAALTLLPVARPWDSAAALDPHVLVAGLLLALIPTAAAYLLYYRGLQFIRDTSLVPVFASAETVVAAVLGVAFFGDVLGAGNLLGIAVVVGSIALLGLSERKGTA